MQSVSSFTAFSAQELRTIKKLYAFRKVAQTINKSKTNTHVFYGSIDALSPNQYSLFREYIMKHLAKDKVQIKIELIPASIFKSFIRFSQFQKIQNRLKGSVYQIKVTFSNENETANSAIESILYKTSFDVFRLFNKINFTEKTRFEFTPSVFLATNKIGAIVPIRFGDLMKNAKSLIIPEANVSLQILQYNQNASFTIIRSIIFIQDKLNKKTSYLAE